MDHQQEMCNETLETILVCSKPSNINNQINNLQDQQHKIKPRPQPEQALKCPRCESTNTKFCYYNNYSLSQPRYLCKSCRRYWTKGGTLRNVPVGGGCRKNKRLSSSSSSSSCNNNNNNNNPFKNKSFLEDHQPLNNPLITGLPSLGYEAVDLNLAFARLQKQSAAAASQSSISGKLGLGFGGDLSIFGNSTNAHCDTFGNSSSTANEVGLFGNQNGNFNNLCTYGFMMGSDDHNYHHHDHHNNKSGASTAMVQPFEESNKQELSINGNNSAGNSNKVLWGFPWQMNAESGTGGPEIDAGRECWNGLASSWHGLLNSPLM